MQVGGAQRSPCTDKVVHNVGLTNPHTDGTDSITLTTDMEGKYPDAVDNFLFLASPIESILKPAITGHGTVDFSVTSPQQNMSENEMIVVIGQYSNSDQ